MKFKKYRFIFLLVALMMCLSITGWSISAHYDHKAINSDLPKETKNVNQIGNHLARKFSNNVPILTLISTGLIGLLGIRRQKNIDNSSTAR
jgi:NADH:ubiquinone oxidoreductase subunit 6 (subunit J)